MGVSWTREQKQVIDLRKRNILVSAAAGSGKTAVLVERIIKMITEGEKPVDIDRLLVVTFTNAAAAEMRERIGNAIEQALEEMPENEHLQRQLTLIHNAQITTIDSFCLYVIRNHFHEIALEPNFRIGDEGELKLLREDVLGQVMLRNYEEKAPEFLAFMDGYATGRNDAAVRNMVLSLYEFSRSYPWPKEWLNNCMKGYEVQDEQALNTVSWMKILTDNIRTIVLDLADMMQEALILTQAADGPAMYEKAIQSDLEIYTKIAELSTFTQLQQALENIAYTKMASCRGFDGDEEKAERVKALRNDAKTVVKKLCKQYFFAAPSVMQKQLLATAPMALELVRLTEEFADAFVAAKRRKNLVDFHDLEHFALQILVDEETKQPRGTAEEFRDTFEEIMIDEYQDSNHVQETILRAISREDRGENNLFMVGDVKQSIYRFRLARPELFMEKYDRYSLEESREQRIDLHKNFRSRKEVLDCTNDIFYKLMKKDLGNVAYDAEAALYPGASYEAAKDEKMFAPEILIVDSNDTLLEDAEYDDKKLLEAKMVAERIRKLKEEQQVTDKQTGELRAVRYSDIVILLRSLSGWADAFVKILNDAGIPAHTILATGYFSATEVQTVLSFLRILDNPRQDIPLTAVLRSPIVGMTDEELAQIRLRSQEKPFCACVLESCEKVLAEEKVQEEWLSYEKKLYDFYVLYRKLRKLVPDTPIHVLIEQLLKESGYGDYAAAMPAGKRRYANLLMLIEKAIAYENTSYKGLFHFVRYIDELQKYDVDFGEADMVSENEDVVRIMSIHKSKGLEFPVVFVSGLGKNFNRQDIKSHMVLHPDYGMGLDFMDGERKIKSPTIAKNAIAKQIDLENLGEELRVLYVALTRAKEKLILTGSRKEIEEELERKKGIQKISYLQRESAAGYLDWLILALCCYGEKYQIRVVRAEELVAEEVKQQMTQQITKQLCMEEIAAADKKRVEEFAEKFAFQYPYQTDITQKSKYSVSELKHRAMREKLMQEEEATPLFETEKIVPYIPTFARTMQAKEEELNQGALRGTAVHRVMECYHFAENTSVREQMEEMLAAGKITPEMQALVKISLVEAFLESGLGERMAKAEKEGRLYREKPFVMGFTSRDLQAFGFGEMPTDAEDLTLIQGIIDVFWIEDDGIVVLDYKTDRVDTPKQLTKRYEAQLQLYAEAIERIYRSHQKSNSAVSEIEPVEIRVKEKLLYSFHLKKMISV